MKYRHIFMLAVTLVLVTAVALGLLLAWPSGAADLQAVTQFENVHDLKLAIHNSTQGAAGADYAVDGGHLYEGHNGRWTAIKTPSDVIVSTVVIDPGQDRTAANSALYIGAANAMAIYRSTDRGANWQQIPLSKSAIGGVTAIAVDASQRLVYVGTDTAGIFRLRDVGSSMILNGQILLNEPVRQIVVDGNGSGLVLARTDRNLLRAENFGLTWITVDNLGSSPTALVLAPASSQALQPVVFVGTVDRGLVASTDGGRTWRLANEGLGFVPGSRLSIDALTIDPLNPDVLYVSTSYLFGSTSVHSTPKAIFMTTNRAETWTTLVDNLEASVVALISVPGQPGDVYALTSHSRTPLAIGNAPALIASSEPGDGSIAAGIQPGRNAVPAGATSQLAWTIAGLAAFALVYAIFVDLRARRRQTSAEEPGEQTQPAHQRIL